MKGFDIYRSSAGSGKTFTLVTNYLSIALATENANAYSRILAITFTNKAAAEMKERIVDYLRILSDTEASSKKELIAAILSDKTELKQEQISKRASAMLRQVLHRYSDFAVSTIDSFVHKIIRAHSRDLDLHPDFVVDLDEVALREEAIDRIIAKAGRDPELSILQKRYAFSQLKEEKNWNFRKNLIDTARILSDEKSAQYLEQLEGWSAQQFLELIEELKQKTAEFERSIGDQASAILTSIGSEENYDHFARGSLPKWLEQLKGAAPSFPSPTLRKGIEEDQLIPRSAKNERLVYLQQVVPIIEAPLKDLLAELDSRFATYSVQQMILKHSSALSLLRFVSDEMQTIQEERNSLIISQFNRLISTVVLDNPAPYIYERLGERYSHIMIDEFQDTSVMQWTNFLPLVQNALATLGYCMVVGDGKQAIYRWRNGDVAQFQRLPKVEIKGSLGKHFSQSLAQHSTLKALESNFRSKAEVIAFNNRFFSQLSHMLSEEDQKIYSDVAQLQTDKSGGYVDLTITPVENSEEEGAAGPSDTAIRVKALLAEGWKPGDIAILCRKRNQAIAIAEQLSADGHQVVSSDSVLLAKHKGVQFVVCMLAYLQAPTHLDKVTGLVQSLVQLSDKDSHEIWKELRPLRKDANKLCRSAFSLVGWQFPPQKWHSLSLLSAYERICECYDKLSSNDVFLQVLGDLCLEKEQGAMMDSRSFVAWWEERSEKLAIDLPPNSDAIQIMTIHKSKGLQFPVVIIPHATWSAGPKGLAWIEPKEEVRNLPVALVSNSKSLENTRYAGIYKEEVAQENLDYVNMLYVACTRAEERLYLSIYVPKKAHSYFKPFLKALTDAFPEWKIPEIMNEKLARHFGEVTAPLKSEENKQESEQPARSNHLRLIDALQFSFSHQRKSSSDRTKSQQEGTALHSMLEHITSVEDWSIELDAWCEENRANQTEKAHYQKLLSKLMEHERGKALFDASKEVKNEWDLLDEEGQMLRPDKVLIGSNDAWVVDFKTGNESKSHLVQIKRYQHLVATILNKPTEASLVYLRVDGISFVDA